MEHRQRREVRTAARSPSIRSSSSSGSGSTARTRPARTRASWRASIRSALPRRTTSTRCSRSTRTACVTPRPRTFVPAEAIADMARIAASGKNIVSSSVVPLVYPPHVAADDAATARGRVSTTADVSCFTSGIDPGWANDLLPLVLTGQCEYIESVRMMEVVNYATYAQPTVLFDTMGFGQALDATPLLLVAGRALVRVGRHGQGCRRRARRRGRGAARGSRAAARARRPSTSASGSWRRGRRPRCASRCRASSTASPGSSSST